MSSRVLVASMVSAVLTLPLVATDSAPATAARGAEPVVVRSLQPASAYVQGGTTVTLRGRGLAAVRKVRFGAVVVPVVSARDRRVQVVAPAHVAGEVAVRLKARSGSWSQPVAFEYLDREQVVTTPQTPPATPPTPPAAPPTPPAAPPPVLDAISPATGPVGGGTAVRLDGSGFSGATRVWFGTDPAASVAVESAQRIVAVPAAHAAGQVAVRVGGAAGPVSTPTAATRFEFVPEPSAVPAIREVSPSGGPVAGGTRVTLTGVGLGTVTQVTFGRVAATDLVVRSDTTLEVTAPAHARGVVTVRVHTPDAESYPGWARFFTYNDDRRVLTATPPGGSDFDDPSVELSDIACAAPGLCVAVGDSEDLYGRRGALVEVLRGGEWVTRRLPDPFGPGSVEVTGVSVDQVECPGPTTCIAVGTWGDGTARRPVAYRWDGATWTVQAIGGPGGAAGVPERLTCTSATTCVTLGHDCSVSPCGLVAFGTVDGTTWTQTPVTTAPDATGSWISDLDCSTPTACVAVGGLDANVDGSHAAAPVLYRFDGTTWTVARAALPPDVLPADPFTSLDTVSCVPEGCYAVGRYRAGGVHERAYLSTITAGGEALTPLGTPDDADQRWRLYDADVDCVSFGWCRATTIFRRTDGAYSSMLVRVDGSAVSLTPVPPLTDGSYPTLGMLICPSTAGCVALGSGGTVQIAETTTFTPVPVPLAPGGIAQSTSDQGRPCDPFLTSLAVDTPTTAVAVGGCYAGPARHGVLATGIPVPSSG